MRESLWMFQYEIVRLFLGYFTLNLLDIIRSNSLIYSEIFPIAIYMRNKVSPVQLTTFKLNICAIL